MDPLAVLAAKPGVRRQISSLLDLLLCYNEIEHRKCNLPVFLSRHMDGGLDINSRYDMLENFDDVRIIYIPPERVEISRFIIQYCSDSRLDFQLCAT